MLRSVVRVHGYRDKCFRYFSSTKQENLSFPPKDDFPNRHIGPRNSDIISMLDVLGFKVKLLLIKSFL